MSHQTLATRIAKAVKLNRDERRLLATLQKWKKSDGDPVKDWTGADWGLEENLADLVLKLADALARECENWPSAQ